MWRSFYEADEVSSLLYLLIESRVFLLRSITCTEYLWHIHFDLIPQTSFNQAPRRIICSSSLIKFLYVCVHYYLNRWNMFAPTRTFLHIYITHPDSIIYLSQEDERKHWLYAAILTLGFRIYGFGVQSPRVGVSGFEGLFFGAVWETLALPKDFKGF